MAATKTTRKFKRVIKDSDDEDDGEEPEVEESEAEAESSDEDGPAGGAPAAAASSAKKGTGVPKKARPNERAGAARADRKKQSFSSGQARLPSMLDASTSRCCPPLALLHTTSHSHQ